MAIQMVQSISEFLLSLFVRFHNYCLEVDGEAVPAHDHHIVTRTTEERGTCTSAPTQ